MQTCTAPKLHGNRALLQCWGSCASFWKHEKQTKVSASNTGCQGQGEGVGEKHHSLMCHSVDLVGGCAVELSSLNSSKKVQIACRV